MSSDDRIINDAIANIKHSGRLLQRLFMALDYNIGPDSPLRRQGEDVSETRLRINLCIVQILYFLKSWTYNKPSIDDDPGKIVPTPESELDSFLYLRAPVVGLEKDEVPRMLDFILKNCLLNRGTSRVEFVLDEAGERYCRREVQLAEAEREGLKLSTLAVEALARLNDLDALIGTDFDLMDSILAARIEQGTSDDVMAAFKYVNEMLLKEISRIKELKAEFRDKKRFQLLTPEDVQSRLDLNLDKIGNFVQELLPARFKQYRNLVLTRETQEDRGGEVTIDQEERLAEIDREVQMSQRALQALVDLVTGTLDDLTAAARHRRMTSAERTFDMDKVVSQRISDLNTEGLIMLVTTMLAPLVVRNPNELKVAWPGMLDAFKVRDAVEPQPEGFTLTLDGTSSRSTLMDAIKALQERCVEDFNERLDKEGELTLLEFALGLDSRTRDEYMAIAAFREVIRRGAPHIEDVGEVVPFEYEYKGSPCIVQFNNVKFRKEPIVESEE